MEDDSFSTIDSLRGTPESEIPLTISPADTSLKDCDAFENDLEDDDGSDDKKPTKKRKSWGQELPVPKTNLPPRYVAPYSLLKPVGPSTNVKQQTSQDRR